MIATSHSTRDRIEALHKEGLLYAHMLEFDLPTQEPQYPLQHALQSLSTKITKHGLSDYFDVMAGKQGAYYKATGSMARKAYATKEGMLALATTALHADFPVDLYTNVSRVGILLDGKDEQNVHPEFFFPRDAYSELNGDQIEFSKRILLRTRDQYPAILDPQLRHSHFTEKVHDGHVCNSTDLGVGISQRRALAANAIKEFWQLMQAGEWPHYKASGNTMNEVSLTTKLPAILSVVVAVDKTVGASERDRCMKDALYLSRWLKSRYPTLLAKNNALSEPYLPIVVYDKDRPKEWEFITPSQAQQMAQTTFSQGLKK